MTSQSFNYSYCNFKFPFKIILIIQNLENAMGLCKVILSQSHVSKRHIEGYDFPGYNDSQFLNHQGKVSCSDFKNAYFVRDRLALLKSFTEKKSGIP
jgi:hypothetical protein